MKNLIALFILTIVGFSTDKVFSFQTSSIASIPHLSVEKSLQIKETSEVFFTSIEELVAADSQGNVFVADRGQNLIYAFDSAGKLLQSFGRKGRGPGEFLDIEQIFIGPDDKVYVLDRLLLRFSSFLKTNEEWVYHDAFTYKLKSPLHQPTGAILIPDGFLLEQSIYYALSIGKNQYEYPVAKIDDEGNLINEAALVLPLDEFAFLNDGNKLGGVNYLPFGRKSILKSGPQNTLHHIWTDQIRIHSLNLNGDTLSAFKYPIINPPVSREEKKYWIDAHIQEMHNLLDKTIPATKPVVQDFFVDEESRFWVNIHPDITGENTWIIFSKSGEPLGRFSIAKNEKGSHVQNNNLYATHESEETGELSVVVYVIEFLD